MFGAKQLLGTLVSLGYAASLLGMGEHGTVDQSYLRTLFGRLRLDDGTIAALHRAVGAPALS